MSSSNGSVDIKDFRVREDDKVDLKKWPTQIKRLYHSKKQMNYPAACCGVSKADHANASHSVTPECFSPGSRSGLAWIPA